MSKRSKRSPAPSVGFRSALAWRNWLWGALLVALVAFVYWPTLDNGFIWDDDFYIEQNPTLESAAGLRDIWFKLGAVPQYYPLVHTSYWLEYRLWGTEPRGYHAVNLLLHAASAVLLWRLLVRLAVPGAWLAAAVFAVHPVHVESVAWATERKNVLSCALALSSLLAYLRFAPATEEPREATGVWGWYALAFACYVGALWSKTVTVSVPAVLLVIFWWKRGRIAWRDVLPLLPLFAVGLALSAVTVYMERTTVGAKGEDWNLTLVERVLLAGRAVWFYAVKLVWPHPVMFFYPRWTIDQGVAWQYLFPLAAVALVVGLYLARGRIGRGPLAAVLVFGGVLFPALGFVNVFPFLYSYVADHFQYHASIAMTSLLAAVAVAALARYRPLPRWLPAGLAAGVILVLAVLARQQTYAYHNLVSLWEDTLAKNPDSWAAHNNLGVFRQERGQIDAARHHYNEAMRIVPKADWPRHIGSVLCLTDRLDEAAEQLELELKRPLDDFTRGRTLVDLGSVRLMQDRLDDAARCFEQASALATTELARQKFGWKAFYSRADLLARQGRHEQAAAKLRAVLEIRPEDAAAHHALGQQLASLGDEPGAFGAYTAAVRFQPANANYHEDLAVVLLGRGDLAQAEHHLRQALELNPQSAKACNNLGIVLAQRGDLRGAVEWFERALHYDPKHSAAADNLAKARAALRPER